MRKGGLVEVVYNLCNQTLKNKDIRLYVLSLRREADNTKINDFIKLGIPVVQLEKSYIQCELFTGSVRDDVQKIVDYYDIDVVHCHGYHPALVGAKLRNVKVVATLHDRADEDFLNSFGNIPGRYMLARYYRALKKNDLNIAVSQSAAELYQKKLHNVSFVNNGIDDSKYQVVDDEMRSTLRKSAGLPPDRKIIISTGRIEKEKRYEGLINWFNQAAKDYPVTLLILGSGSRLDACKQLAKENKNVMFTGRVSNVADYLKCSDFYISYSKSEGMSMAVCEAISCGLYPILSDIPSHRDVARKQDGMFFETPFDIDLKKILSMDVDREKLHAHISQHFSVVTMVNGYLRKYSDVVSDN